MEKIGTNLEGVEQEKTPTTQELLSTQQKVKLDIEDIVEKGISGAKPVQTRREKAYFVGRPGL